MNFHLTSAEDCKSSIHRFDSDPRLHSKNDYTTSSGWGISYHFPALTETKRKNVDTTQKLDISHKSVKVPVTITSHGSYVSLKFKYKNTARSSRIYAPIDQITGKDISTQVRKVCHQIDGTGTIQELLDLYLEHGTGGLSTRKKNVAHLLDYFKREGWNADQSITFLDYRDELGRTIPERLQHKYNLPHKLRQIRSIFGRRNIVLFKHKGWDTSYFGNFIGFIPESCVSQPFTTDDQEVGRIINFFDKARLNHPVFYDIYMLAFGCGLRKSEIYQVKYEHFTTFNNQHFLLLPFATKRTKLKQLDHVEKVGISKQVYDHFTGREKTGFCINGGERLHRRFIKFLKNDLGITDNKACHRLRKILGARLASTAGIYHAAKTLRNSVSVAERYYSDLTEHKNELEV